MTSALCQLCRTIPLQDLPQLPEKSFFRALSGQKYQHELVHSNHLDDIPDVLGFHHHRSLESLRSASSSGCELCHLIEVEADALLADIADKASKYTQFPDVLKRLTSDPSFDLWVTRRPEGGDGLWVVTKSTSTPKGVVFVVATLGFASEDDDPLASTFHGRPVNGLPDHKVLDRVASWVMECNDAHKGCTSRDCSLPTRIIDVGTSDAGSVVKLVEVDEGTKGDYIALSYCWGAGTNHFTTSRDSLLARKAGIHLPDLPQTFQDVIAMVRVLGVRYLWIDSICICQDDLADWERESARMASVYSNAYLIIAATGQPNSSGGLFFERPSTKYLRLPLRTVDGTEGQVLIYPLNKAKEFIKSYRIEMRSEPLAERAWAFQERVLAQRVLHFASDQVSFECLEGSRYEDGMRLPGRYYCIHQKQPTEDMTDEERAQNVAMLRGNKGTPKGRWNALLWVYGCLKLTYPSDKLPALAGIAKVYSKLIDDEYIAGIWRKTMIEDLCWQGLKCNAVSGYRAPSWSWASVDGIAANGFRGGLEILATILDYQVEVDGDNPFGRVKSGWIKMEASVVPLTLSEETAPTGHMCLRTERGDDSGVYASFDTIDRSYEVSAAMIRDMKLFALVLATQSITGKQPNSEATTFYESVIVTPAEDAESSTTSLRVVKRMGIIHLKAENFGPNELNDSKCVIKFV